MQKYVYMSFRIALEVEKDISGMCSEEDLGRGILSWYLISKLLERSVLPKLE